jgi:hypothetical protein
MCENWCSVLVSQKFRSSSGSRTLSAFWGSFSQWGIHSKLTFRSDRSLIKIRFTWAWWKVQSLFDFLQWDKRIIFQEPSDSIDMFCRTGSTRPWRVFKGRVAVGEPPRPVLDATEGNRILTISCANSWGYFPVKSALHPEKMNHPSDLQRHLRILTIDVPT